MQTEAMQKKNGKERNKKRREVDIYTHAFYENTAHI
jgi:hypothetical protein